MKLITIITIISGLLLLISAPVPGDNSSVSQAIITTGVTSAARPKTDNLTVIDHAIGSVTFYTELVGFKGQLISHKWFYKEKEVASISLSIESDNSLNWTRTSISIDQIGHWEARVVNQQGDVLAMRHFDVIESARSVQQIINEKQIDTCDVKLADLKEKISANPNIKYYQFLYKKQAARCNMK